MLTAIAPATDTEPPPLSPVAASGVEVEPEDLPVFCDERVLASPSPSELLSDSSLAPATLAFALVTLVDAPDALNDAPPPLEVRLRSRIDSTMWLTTASAIATPTPTSLPLAAPSAVVVAVAV